MSTAKKIFIISSVLLATVLFFLGIYNVSFKEKELAADEKEETKNSPEKIPLNKSEEKGGQKNKAKIYRVSENSVMSPVLSDDGEKILYYSRPGGSVYEVYLGGEKEAVIDSNNFSGLEKVLWSSDRNRVLSRFSKGGKIEYSSYDYKTKKASLLDGQIEYAIWNNLGDGIIYKYSDLKTGKKTLNVSDPDGRNWKKLADITGKNSFISMVPQSSLISFWNSPDAFEETSLNTVGVVGGEPKKIFSGRFGADYLWSPNGTKVLMSSSDSKGGSKISLGTANGNGGEFQNLNVPTFVSKCIWSKDSRTIYYALPGFSSDSAVLPNDYQSGKISSKDTFWKMDIGSGKADRIVEAKDISDSYDASSLFLSPSEDILFFINKSDGKLYGINL